MRLHRIFFLSVVLAVFHFIAPDISFSREMVLYSFEKDPQGWSIPDWAFVKKDHVAKQVSISEFHSSDGKYSLEMDTEFTGPNSWEAAYVERVVDVTDWSPFSYLSVDICIPKDAPRGLRARVILTVGDEWKWSEMNKSVPLSPGEWVILKTDLTANSTNWRRFISDEFRSDIRKLGVRIESNGKIVYKGPVYIDNVKLSD